MKWPITSPLHSKRRHVAFLRWCLTAAVWLGFGATIDAKNIVLMIGEDEYQTWETLPRFADHHLVGPGNQIVVVLSDVRDKNDFPGLVVALRQADVLVVSVRRRTPKREQIEAIKAFLNAGKPLVGIRTACHAFSLAPKTKLPEGSYVEWPEFDREVLGGNYAGHHSYNKASPVFTNVVAAEKASGSQLLSRVDVSSLRTETVLYKVRPISLDSECLLVGSIPDQTAEPIAWTRTFGKKHARIFFTSLGAPNDFANPHFSRLLVNAINWALGPQ